MDENENKVLSEESENEQINSVSEAAPVIEDAPAPEAVAVTEDAPAPATVADIEEAPVIEDAPAPATSAEPEAAPSSVEAPWEAPEKKSNKTFILVAILLILAIAGVVTAIILIKQNGSKEEEETFHQATADLSSQAGTNNENSSSDNSSEAGNTSSGESTSDTETTDYSYADLVVECSVKDYKGITVTKTVSPVTQEEIEQEVSSLLASYTSVVEVTDRTTVQNGDTVSIDFAGFRDGEQFEGGTSEDYPLVIGSGSFIDGFEEGLIGVNVGEKVTLHLTFPDPYYNNPDLAGQPVDFEVTVNSIQTTVIPELTDEFLAANTDYATVEAYLDYVNATLIEDHEAAAESDATNEVFEIVIRNSTYSGDIDKAISLRAADISAYYEAMANYFAGCDAATFFTVYYGMSADEYNNYIVESSTKQTQLKYSFVEIAKLENITFSEEEYNELVEQYLGEYGLESEEELLENISKQDIEEELLYNLAYDWVLEHAIIN